ncbi:hypothetical protein K443DRAFT_36346, partial [Laccaria amethystina LaAM-08-1]
MTCKYCPASEATPIVHRDVRCLSHLAKTDGQGNCKHVPPEVRREARRLLMLKAGIEKVGVSDEDGEVEIVEESSVGKKQKGTSGSAVAVKRPIDAFLDRAMTEVETDKANIWMLRFFIHRNIPFSAADNPFFRKWVQMLRPSYGPASRYTL